VYHIKVEQAAKLKGKLALVDCECADVFLAEEGSYLVTNTMEAFCYVPLGTEASQGEDAHSFRINRKLLMSLLADGEMVVTFEENGIRIVFLTPEGEVWLIYTVQIARAAMPERSNLQSTAEIRRKISRDSGYTWGKTETIFDMEGIYCGMV